ARLGLQGLCGRPTPEDWAWLRAERIQYGHDPDNVRTVQGRFLYVAETDEQARAEAQAHGEWVQSHYRQWLKEANAPSLGPEIILGSPETVIRHLEGFIGSSSVPLHQI